MIITPNDVRHFMMDRDAADNFLLDDVEMDDATITAGLRYVVDGYNSMPPYVEVHEIDTFPYRNEALQGVAAYCLRATAMNKKRNESTSRTEGGTVLDDTKGKAEFYANLAASLSAESTRSLQAIKISINVESCYRSFI